MDELVDFVRRCLDEDEQVAAKCLQSPADYLAVQLGTFRWEAREDGVWQGSCLIAPGVADFAGVHIARWDPARVLGTPERMGEVETKRRILELHGGEQGCPKCWSSPCETVRLLAQPYAGQPGWREEWRA